jgi:PAS domain S-box-containing protein
MSKNTKTASPHQSMIRIVGEMAGLLTHARIQDDNLRQALRILCRAVSAHAGNLFRKVYDPSEAFQIEAMSFWAADDEDAAMTLSADDIPDSIWQAMEKKEIIQSKAFISGFSDNHLRNVFLPVFMGENLSGFILISGVEAANPTPEVEAFLIAVIGIFELWFSKMNESKKVDDLLNFVPIPMLGVNTDGITTAWNTAVEEMTGWEASRVVGKGNYECSLPFYGIRRPMIVDLLMNPDPKWEATYLDYKREGDVVHSQAFIPLVTGAGRFVTGITSKMRDFNGRVFGSLHHIRDITHERHVESRLKSSESMFKTITDYAGLGIALFGRERAFYYNERFENLILVSGKEIDLQDLLNAVSEEEQEKVRFRLQKMFDGTEKGPLRLELQVKTEAGNLHYSSYAQMLEYEGSPTICFILDDTTELKEMAEKARLNELKMYHEDRLVALGTMAAGIAHELNQPLNTIRVVTDGLFFGKEKGWPLDEEELFDSLEMVSRQVARMSAVIRNIRNFAREDRMLTSLDVHANQAIENVFSMIGRQLEAHGIRIRKELETGLPPLRANPNRLEQVIMNLVVNARQALDECVHDHKELWVQSGVRDQQVFIKVGDNATGICETHKRKIFDPFFTTKEVGKGTGLGLTITQSIIKDFEGRIETFNNEKGGATFVVTIPRGGQL